MIANAWHTISKKSIPKIFETISNEKCSYLFVDATQLQDLEPFFKNKEYDLSTLKTILICNFYFIFYFFFNIHFLVNNSPNIISPESVVSLAKQFGINNVFSLYPNEGILFNEMDNGKGYLLPNFEVKNFK